MNIQLYIYILLAICISLQTINGQTIRSHIICDVDEVIVNVNSSGVIQHVQRDSNISCTLLLSGFVSGGYVSIPGVDFRPSFGCEQYTTVTINTVPYCVRGDQSNNQVIVKLTNEQLIITLPSADAPGFELNYYSNVAVCGTDLKIPDGAEVYQLSGVISSSYEPRLFTTLAQCTVRLIDLPSPPVSVIFESLHMSLPYPLYIRDKQFTPSDSKGSTLLVTTDSERTINVNYISPVFVEVSFVLNYTVLHCGDIPSVPYSTNSTTPTPWLPGSMVTYVCVDGWKLKYDIYSTIECIVDRSREIAVWSDHSNIQCIPEPWCHSPPNAIDNSTFILSEDNLTAIYQCIDGYTTNNYVSDRTINCTSSDKDTTPWTWSSPPLFVCTPVECNVCPPECLNIANGRSAYKRYYYTQQLQYQCDVGYMRVQEVVECTSNGSWSALSVCVPVPSTTPTTPTTSAASPTSTETGYITAIATTSTLAAAELCVIIALVIYILRRVPKPPTQRQSTKAKTAVTDEYEEVAAAPIRHADNTNIAVVTEGNNASSDNGGYESLELTSRVNVYDSLTDI